MHLPIAALHAGSHACHPRRTLLCSASTKSGGPSDDEYGLLWWIIGKPKQAGYYALGFGGQLTVVLPKSRAVIVYLSDAQPDSQIDGKDLKPLDNVLVSTFPS